MRPSEVGWAAEQRRRHRRASKVTDRRGSSTGQRRSEQRNRGTAVISLLTFGFQAILGDVQLQLAVHGGSLVGIAARRTRVFPCPVPGLSWRHGRTADAGLSGTGV